MFRRLMWLFLGWLGLSEALIVYWAWWALEGEFLRASAFPLLVAGVVAANLVTLTALRSRAARARRSGFLAGRLFMIASIGALLAGPLLAALLLAAGAPALLLGSDFGVGSVGRGALLAFGGAGLAGGFGPILWGWLVGGRRVVVERLDLDLPHLAAPLVGLRIAHITDLHIGPQLNGARLREFVERTNAVGADIIAITGDIFDFDPAYVDEGCVALAGLDAPLGVFGVLGNHDVYTGSEAVAEGLARHTRIRLLRDTHARIEVEGSPLYLLGIDDPGRLWETHESPALARIAAEVPAEAPRILLVHRPNYFEQVVALGLPAALAGHTHGGQISLPGSAGRHNISRLLTRYTRGFFRRDDTVLYVNRGLGVGGPPVRLNCPREIALLRLVPREAS